MSMRHHGEPGQSPEPDLPLSPDERQLQALLHDAAAHVTPTDRLGDLRRRTISSSRSARRGRWLPFVVATGLTTAAVVGIGVAVGDLGLPEETPTAQRPQTGVAAPTVPAAVYYLSDTNDGTRLFREFAAVPSAPAEDAVTTALHELAADAGPDDPDYRTAWPAGSFAGAEVATDRIWVDLSRTALERPQGMSADEARLGVQQVVYTAEAAIGISIPVEFRYDGVAATSVLGERVDGPVERDRRFAVTAPLNISDPAEGVTVSETLTARGIAARSVVQIRWRLRNLNGQEALKGRTIATRPTESPDATAIPAWETGPIDVSALPPGSYQFVVTGVRREPGSPDIAFHDDRTVVVG